MPWAIFIADNSPLLEAIVRYPKFILHQVRDNIVALLISFTLLFAGLYGQGQAVDKGVITGQVNDGSGAILSGATVRLYNMATDLTTEVKTDAKGLFASPPLSPLPTPPPWPLRTPSMPPSWRR